MLDRDTLHFKQSVSVRYAQLIYDGLWFSTLREALAGFVDETEKEMTGEVRVRLYKGHAEPIGRRSPRSLTRGRIGPNSHRPRPQRLRRPRRRRRRTLPRTRRSSLASQ